jgi:acetylornithine deacetylase
MDKIQQDVQKFVTELIRIPSTPGCEQAAMDYAFEKFSQMDVEVEKIALSNAIKSDPDYSSPIEGIEYEGRYNLRISRKGSRPGTIKLFNAHMDVVPPSQGMAEPWSGRVEDGVIYGRGACDDKGPLTCVYAMFRELEAGGFDFPGEIIAHIVVEEENGGNGSLAMARRGERGDCCVVLEPTDYKLLTSIRGAVWFKIDFAGKAGHSGQAGKTKSALLMAVEAIRLLTEYHAKLLSESKGIELFDKYDNPMPITFGKLESGNWPAAAPDKARLEGVLGFLPNKTKEDIRNEMKASLLKSEMLTEDNFTLDFTYRHDCSVTDPGSDFVSAIITSARECGEDIEIDAMPASCDAWFYNNQLGIDTVVYGPGTLGVAHSKDEQIKLEEIFNSAKVLCRFVTSY